MIKTNKTMVFLMLVVVLALSIISPGVAFAQEDMWEEFGVTITGGKLDVNSKAEEDGSTWNTLIGKYKDFITGIAAVGAVTMVVLFIMQFLKLGASAGNPNARSQAVTGLLWTGLAAAGLGAVALITGIFYGAISS